MYLQENGEKEYYFLNSLSWELNKEVFIQCAFEQFLINKNWKEGKLDLVEKWKSFILSLTRVKYVACMGWGNWFNAYITFLHPSRPFYRLIYQTISPEILSSLVANERSGSLLSGDVPGYEIWSWVMQVNVTVMNMLQWCDSNENESLLIHFISICSTVSE